MSPPGSESPARCRRFPTANLRGGGPDTGRIITESTLPSHKHFKWAQDNGGKRRIHERPNQDEVEACHPWLDQELWLIRPEVLVCLGGTAASAVLKRRVTISPSRGRALVSPQGIRTFVTVHPSALLRIPSKRDREAEAHHLADDLRRAARSA
ncbi:MAG: uracil-DNA glycosylase family protein [Candidatus Rokuibacteriota bacterium]